MLINSAVFGHLEVSPQDVYHVPDGMLGFEGVNEYALISKQQEDVTLRWFQAVDANVPCFIVFDPDEVIEGYSPQLDPSDLKALNCTSSSELSYLLIGVIPDDVSKATVNLKSPIALNTKTNMAKQVIASNKDYPIQFYLSEDA